MLDAGRLTEVGKRRRTDGRRRMRSLLAGGALAGFSLHRRSPTGLILGACAIPLLYAGLTGRRIVKDVRLAVARNGAVRPVDVRRSLTIKRPREEVYAFWRQLERLPEHMRHLTAVDAVDESRHRWVIDLPGVEACGRAFNRSGVEGRFEWLTEITADDPGHRLAWRSLPGGDLRVDGAVRFVDAPADRGTEVHVRFAYRPPGGRAGRLLSRTFGKVLSRLVHEDVRRIKHVLEAGEIPTIEGQPVGRR